MTETTTQQVMRVYRLTAAQVAALAASKAVAMGVTTERAVAELSRLAATVRLSI